MPDLLAISDLHVRYAENRRFTDRIRPANDGDWLIVAGDVGDRFGEIVGTLDSLRQRFEQVIWVPGNHELWTRPDDHEHGRGRDRYDRLIAALRELDVRTPQDDYLTWPGPTGEVIIAPLFVLYDYTFFPVGANTLSEAIAAAEAAGVVCTDEALLHPDPYPSRADWAAARLAYTQDRLDRLPIESPTVLINHWPLVREPCDPLRFPEFALWCGTTRTADWPVRFCAQAVVYGHLHIPRTLIIDNIPHHEVSLGYPREWGRSGAAPRSVRKILRGAMVAE